MFALRSTLAILGFLGLFVSACGGSVTVPSGAGAGGGGSGSAGGDADGGEGGALPAEDAGAPAKCGGKMGLLCGPSEWCSFDPSGSCGSADMFGTCKPRPDVCPKHCPGVCGCDGAFYCNDCMAQSAGTDVQVSKACLSQNASYFAFNLYTNVPRFAVYKADTVRNLCVRIIFSPSVSDPPEGIKPPEDWGIEHLILTNNASDCETAPGFPTQPVGSSVEPIWSAGAMSLEHPSDILTPCSITIHGTLEFAPGDPWIPASEPLDVDALNVEGGCG